MFPLKDENPHPIGFKPIVTYSLIFLNVVAFIYEILYIGQFFDFTNKNALELFYEFGTVPNCIIGSDVIKMNMNYQEMIIKCPDAQYFRLVTSMFLHGGLMHLGGNMLFLWIFGDNIELKFGKFKYILAYCFWGISAGLLHVLGDINNVIPAIGASGAISGILGAYLMIFPKAKIITFMMWGFFWRTIRIQAKWFLPFWLIFQNIFPLFVGGFGFANEGVAYLAHIGGFSVGLIFGYVYKITHKTEFSYR